ncbi:MAG: PIN domain-containing protein [Prevotellaceae bacterium]|jgi:predicted nucleic acid-binding protein|nr:PIN domain-containing protein [Prevotellaceae bacterium]
MKFRLYLDNCCFNRPYDDQSYLVIYLETEAKLFIQQKILQGTFELVWSYMLDYENSFNPYENRLNAIAMWRDIAVLDIDASDEIVELGKKIIQKGIKNKDALHIASAIYAKCDYFLTTDKKLLSRNFDEIKIINPLDFIKLLGVNKI